MRFLPVCFLWVGLMSAQAEDEGYLLAKKEWHIPVGVKVEGKFARNLRKGKMKVISDGGWTSGTVTSQDRAGVVVERTAEDSYRLTYGKLVSKYLMFFDGEKSHQVDESPLHEKVVQADFQGGEWKAKVIEGDLDEVNPDLLAGRLRVIEESIATSYGEQFYGLAPRKVGERWKLDKPVLPGMEGIEVLEGEAEVTFQKVGEFQGLQCAYIQVKFDVTTNYTEGVSSTMKITGEGVIIRALDLQLDLHFKSGGRMISNSEMEGDTSVKTEGKYDLLQETHIVTKPE